MNLYIKQKSRRRPAIYISNLLLRKIKIFSPFSTNMRKAQLSKQLVAFSGEHYVAARIGLMGYVPLMTSSISSRFPGSDILVLNFATGKTIYVQVKTVSYQKRVSWYVPENVDGMEALFVFNKISEDKKSLISYIAPSDIAAKESKEQREDYISTHPNVDRNQPRMIREDSLKNYLENWIIFKERLGNPDGD